MCALQQLKAVPIQSEEAEQVELCHLGQLCSFQFQRKLKLWVFLKGGISAEDPNSPETTSNRRQYLNTGEPKRSKLALIILMLYFFPFFFLFLYF